MKTVLAFGTYDLFHPGHAAALTEAAALGDRLVVVVARDANVAQLKGRAPHELEEARLAAVVNFEYVDEARLGYEEWGKHLQVLEDTAPDIIALGYDQRATLPEGPWKVVRLAAFDPHLYKSSIIRKQILE